MAPLTVERRIVTLGHPARQISRHPRARHSRSFQRQVLSVTVNVTAFKSHEETVSISFDGYNLLQASLTSTSAGSPDL